MEKYFELLYKGGASEVKKIDTSSIVTAPWTVYKCKFGCDFYNKSYSCPPHVPTWRETRKMIDCFSYGILFNMKDGAKKGVSELAVEVSKEVFLDGYYKAIAFGSGPCLICKECPVEHCNFPKKTLPAMEGCGIDVFATARNNGFKIVPVRERSEEHNYFGLILVE